jgi:dipeptidase D
LSVAGLSGGHSGINIHEGRANANILLCDVLQRLQYVGIDLSLMSIGKCGVASNAIPSNAAFVVAVPSCQSDKFISELALINENLRARYRLTDSDLDIGAVRCGGDQEKRFAMVEPYSVRTLTSLLFLIRAIPDGPFAWVEGKEDEFLVETSNNVAMINEDKDAKNISITCMIRSSVDEKKYLARDVIKSLCGIVGAEFEDGYDSPGWAYKEDNGLRDLFLRKYRDLFGVEGKALAIHAGLECGHFARQLGDIDMVACGPDLHNVHSVKEGLYVDTVENLMGVLVEVLKSF